MQALRTFLAYAQTGRLDGPAPSAVEAVAPFEDAVGAALTAAGCQVRSRVGPAGSAIDLAVVDPQRPGHYLLGLECDGPIYQDARSARDRDRLRRQVLEGLGWRLHRLWSPDWLRETRRASVIGSWPPLEEARAPAPASDPVERPESEEAAVAVVDDSRVEDGQRELLPAEIPAYQPADLIAELGGLDLTAVPAARLASWVDEVVRIEGPVHIAEVARRITEAARVWRLGPRVQEAIEAAGAHALEQGSIRRQEEFLWPMDMQQPVVRDRSGLPAPSRKLELVAPEEIARAIGRVVRDGFGLEPGAIPAAACRLLGLVRLSDEMRRRVEAIVGELIQQQRLVPQGDHLVIPDLQVVG